MVNTGRPSLVKSTPANDIQVDPVLIRFFELLVMFSLFIIMFEGMNLGWVMSKVSKFPKNEINMRKEIADLQEVIKKFEATG